MTWQFIAVRLLLILGVGVEALCCLGLLAMRSTFARIHFVGPATLLGATSIAAAIVVQEALSPAGIKSILIALILIAASPFLSHLTGRAAYLRRYGSLSVPEGGAAMIEVLQVIALLLVAAGGTAVVLTRDPLRQTFVLGLFGFLLAILFLLVQAPDVAFSELAVGTVALPLLILLALAKVRGHDQ